MLDEIAGTVLGEEVDAPPLIEDLLVARADGNRRVVQTYRGWLKVGAGAIAAAVVTLLAVTGRDNEPVGRSFGTGEVVTGASESTTVRLGDGSVVRLGPRSRLRVTGDPDSREVWMEGHAYFAVARDESRPFRVRTLAGDAIVLGTRFDLEAREDEMRVLVVEGAVRMGAAGSEVKVVASEVGMIDAGGGPTSHPVGVEELDRELEWVGDFIAFENTPLSQAADELSRRFDIPVVVLDSLAARETVRATFTDGESLGEIVRVLCRAVSVHCSVLDDRVTIGL